MSKMITWSLIVLLIIAVFFLAPLLLSGDESEYASSEESVYMEEDDADIDLYKKKTYSKSARSVGGSRSFKSGK